MTQEDYSSGELAELKVNLTKLLGGMDATALFQNAQVQQNPRGSVYTKKRSQGTYTERKY
jgi:hypothetical protein